MNIHPDVLRIPQIMMEGRRAGDAANQLHLCSLTNPPVRMGHKPEVGYRP
jgi:hypothetical protein